MKSTAVLNIRNAGSGVKNPLATQEMWVQSLGREDSLQKDMPAWGIPWIEDYGPWGLKSRT